MDRERISHHQKLLGPLVLLFCGTAMLRLSWFKWPDLIVDYGREVYVPWQITLGKVLYIDLNVIHGPLASYLNALLFYIFGTGITTLVFFNIVLVALITFLIYDLFRSTFGHFIATLAGICFLILFAFSQYVGIGNYNFICPYSHEMTYGICLFFGELFIFRRYLIYSGLVFASLMGFLMGLIFLTRVEVFLASFVTLSAGLILTHWQAKLPPSRSHCLSLLLFFLLPIIPFFIYFSFHVSFLDAFLLLTKSYVNIFNSTITHNIFHLRIMGLDDPTKNLILMFEQAGSYLVLFTIAGLISYFFPCMKNRILRSALMILIFGFIFGIILFRMNIINWGNIARPYPIFLLFLLLVLTERITARRDDKDYRAQYLPFLLLTLFSLLFLLRMPLNVHLYHYGFAMAMPASLVIVAILFHYIPDWLSQWGNKNVAASFIGLFFCLALFAYGNKARQIYELKNYVVGKGRDAFYTYDARIVSTGPIVNEALKYIDKSIYPIDSLAVLPEGVMLNYLSRKANPSSYFEFTPSFVDIIGEDKIVNSFSRPQPSLIILIKRDMSEYGPQFFGRDYAPNVYAWILNNYEKVFDPGDALFKEKGAGFLTIMARKH